LKPNRDLYLKSLKEYLPFASIFTYHELLGALNEDNFDQDFDFFVPFAREIVNHYGQFHEKMNVNDILSILNKIAVLGIRSPGIYNLILQGISKQFNSLRNEDKVNIIHSFSLAGIKQSDLFDKLLEKIWPMSGFVRTFVDRIARDLYYVGHDTPEVKAGFLQAVQKLDVGKRSTLYMLLYTAILSAPEEAEIIKTKIAGWTLPDAPKFTDFDLVYLAEYLRVAYPNQPEYSKTVLAWIKPNTIETYHRTLEGQKQNIKALVMTFTVL
jgi:hypothetical protein